MSMTSIELSLYLVGGRVCVAATSVEVWGWKAGTASSVYMPPLCLWFKLTISVITTSPVSCVKHRDPMIIIIIFFYCCLITKGSLGKRSYCKGKACVFGDVPVPREHRWPPASLWWQPRPPEVSVIFGNTKGIGNIKVCQLFKHLHRRKTL